MEIKAGDTASPATRYHTTSNFYRHEPLDLSQMSIRLLRVMRSPDGLIHCSIQNAHISAQYQCLSYCWGPSDETQPRHEIRINGAPFKILSNLWAFLDAYDRAQQLPTAKKPKFLWIDALCIDQTSTTERK